MAMVEKPELEALFALVKVYSGGGLVALPFSMYCAGTLGGILGFIFIGIYSSYTLCLLIECRYFVEEKFQKKSPSYAEIGYQAAGRLGYELTRSGIVVTNLGIVIGYMVFCANMLENVFDPGGSLILAITKSRAITITPMLLFVSPAIILLSLSKAVEKYVNIINILGNISVVVVFVAVIVKASTSMPANGWDQVFDHLNTTMIAGASFRIQSYPSFLGIVAFSFVIHGVVLSIEDRMSEQRYPKDLPTNQRIYRAHIVIVIATLLITLLYLSFSLVGIASFLDDIQPSIMNNLQQTVFIKIVSFLFCISLLASFPLLFIASFKVIAEPPPVGLQPDLTIPLLTEDASLRDVEDNITVASDSSEDEDDCITYSPQQAWKLVIVIVCIIIAVLFGSLFGELISFVGALSMSLLAFILPFYFHLILLWNEISVFKRAFHIILLLLGVGIMICSTIDSVLNIYKFFLHGTNSQCIET